MKRFRKRIIRLSEKFYRFRLCVKFLCLGLSGNLVFDERIHSNQVFQKFPKNEKKSYQYVFKFVEIEKSMLQISSGLPLYLFTSKVRDK